MAEEDRKRVPSEDGQRVSAVHRVGRSRYSLEIGTQRVPLLEGDLVVGRAADCDVVLDSQIVSRRHARLSVGPSGVHVEDLGSSNGVWVDDRKITEKTRIAPGARIKLADVELVLVLASKADERSSRVTAPAGVPIPPGMGATPPAPRPRSTSEERTRRLPALDIASGVVDRALALGRVDDAERLLGNLLGDVMSDATGGRHVADDLAQAAAKNALKLALATKKTQWAEYPIRLYSTLNRVLPLVIVDELSRAARVTRLDVLLIDRYAEKLAKTQLGPAERFALERVKSLARSGGR